MVSMDYKFKSHPAGRFWLRLMRFQWRYIGQIWLELEMAHLDKLLTLVVRSFNISHMGIFTGFLEANYDTAFEREPGEQGKAPEVSSSLPWYSTGTEDNPIQSRKGLHKGMDIKKKKIIADHLKIWQPKLESAALQL